MARTPWSANLPANESIRRASPRNLCLSRFPAARGIAYDEWQSIEGWRDLAPAAM
jgi:hypothetical protein